jgi:hypothetical protein
MTTTLTATPTLPLRQETEGWSEYIDRLSEAEVELFNLLPASPNFSDFRTGPGLHDCDWDGYHAAQASFIDASTPLKAQVLKTLVKSLMIEAGLKELTVEYEGMGDAGEPSTIEGVESSHPAYEHLDDVCWAFAYHLHPGFEINEGGSGTLEFKLLEDGSVSLEMEHNDRYVETTTSTHNY